MSTPTASILVSDTALKIGDTALVTFTFSERVFNFGNGALTVTGGALTAVATTDSGLTWTATLTPNGGVAATGTMIVLDNTAVETVLDHDFGLGTTNSNAYNTDTVRPTATIVIADTSIIVHETPLVTITFSEAVTGFANADLTIAHGFLTNVATANGGLTWTANYWPDLGVTDATNVITLNNAGVADQAGNAGVGTTDSNNYAIDTLWPSATITMSDAALKIGETSLVTFTFNEPVTGLTNASLWMQNGTMSTIATADGGLTWTSTFTPTAGIQSPGNEVSVNTAGATDAAGQTGVTAAFSSNFSIDTLRPTVTSIVVADPNLTTGETSLVTFTFSEAMTGFDNSDLTVAGGALSAVSSSNGGSIWTAIFTPGAPINDATNLITLANTGITDLAGNAATGTTDSNNYTIVTAAPPPEPDPVPTVTTPVITGSAGADVIVVFNPGSSTVSAGAGNDMIQVQAGGGPDIVFGELGDDTIQASGGADVLQGNQGADSVSGGGGADTVHGGQGNDMLQGNTGADYMTGDSGADVAFGGQGGDFMQGNTGADTISGDLGADVLLGGQGDDRLSGGDDNDLLSGDLGDDMLNGGAGADVFQFNRSGGGVDTIEDFSSAAHDMIRLTGFTSFADLAGRITTSGAETVIALDGGASIHLLGVTGASLTAADFLFA